ncbi:MAG: response regulator transcription factor [Planctomycetes bacterium]|nr:response regulator transcription factor [Planctomycetota bacterium]
MPGESVVFVVDDDQGSRTSVVALVRSMGLKVESFSSAEKFLEFYTGESLGCVVTDMRMLGMSGLELQERLSQMGATLPVIVLTAYATTPLAVRAMQSGAVTMLDKPCQEDELWNAIRKALALDTQRRAEQARCQEIRDRLSTLTPSERIVLNLVVAGKANKVIAQRLEVSIRTVENRRRDVFKKMQAESAVELVRLVVEAGVDLGEEGKGESGKGKVGV